MNQDFTTAEYINACVKQRIIDKIAKTKEEDAKYYEEHKYHSDRLETIARTLNGVLYDFVLVECNLILDTETPEVEL